MMADFYHEGGEVCFSQMEGEIQSCSELMLPDLEVDSVARLVITQDTLWVSRDLRPESADVIERALQTDAVARRILAKQQILEHGQVCGVRLNLNILRTTSVAVHSIHKASSKDGHTRGHGFYRGSVIAYLPVITLRQAYFNVCQRTRQRIAEGSAAKSPMASIDGMYQRVDGPHNFDGVEVRFNPLREHTFVDLRNDAVEFADEVTVCGHRAYARGIRYFTKETAPIKAGNAPSAAHIRGASSGPKRF